MAAAPHAERGVSELRVPFAAYQKRQRTGAVQDAIAPSQAPENAKPLGLRLSSGALAGKRPRNSEAPQ